ncbi:MAG: AbrB family transcriptional regulator [Actinomycetota bacterium]|nr:AbrB family transcriptional regulator [Actinomycetota bacterium]
MEGEARISVAVTVIVALFFGAAGAFLGHRLGVPAGVLVGTLVGVSIAVGGGTALLKLPPLSVPSWTNGVLQISLGMLVGFRMTREELRSGVHALVPALVVTFIIISSGIAAALAAASLTSIDVVTAVFAAAPGGLTQMSAVSLAFGADGAAVATVQLVRVLLALAVVSFLLKRFGLGGKQESASSQNQDTTPAEKTGYAEDVKRLGMAAPWGILGGIAGLFSGAPAGGIIGGLLGAAAFRLLTARPVPVRKFQVGVQVLAGGVIGLGVSGDFLGEIARLAGAGALIIASQMLLWAAMSWLLVHLFRYDLSTSALASSPGGLSGIIPAASDANADEVVVTFIHLVRLSTIIVVVPVIVALFFGERV